MELMEKDMEFKKTHYGHNSLEFLCSEIEYYRIMFENLVDPSYFEIENHLNRIVQMRSMIEEKFLDMNTVNFYNLDSYYSSFA